MTTTYAEWRREAGEIVGRDAIKLSERHWKRLYVQGVNAVEGAGMAIAKIANDRVEAAKRRSRMQSNRFGR